jgi:GT2 family glycosyltransferase
MPSVAVVILNFNGRAYLEQFLPSVTGSAGAGVEVIVADNASADDSVAFVERAFPTVRIIRNTANNGYAGGYNEALAQVSADYYVLLNSDVEVTPGWIEPVIALMESDPAIGACQPKILAYHGRDSFEYAGAAGGWMDSLGYPFARGRIFEYCETDTGQYDMTVPIFWASGAALFIRSGVYHGVGGLDTYFFAHQEEIDLCWRLQAAGYRVFACPASVVYHVGGGTLPKGNRRKVMLNFRNNLLLLLKNMPAGRLCWVFPLRYLLDVIAAFRELAGGNVAYWKAIMQAHGQVWCWLLSRSKPGVWPSRRVLPADGVFRGSIVWQYFIRKRQTFGKIIEDRGKNY